MHFSCARRTKTATQTHTHSIQWRKKQRKWKERKKNRKWFECRNRMSRMYINNSHTHTHKLIRIIKFIIFHVWLLLFTVSYSFYFLSINSNILNHNNFDRKPYDWNCTYSVCNMHIYVYCRAHQYNERHTQKCARLDVYFFSCFSWRKNTTALKWILDIYQSLDSTAI